MHEFKEELDYRRKDCQKNLLAMINQKKTNEKGIKVEWRRGSNFK